MSEPMPSSPSIFRRAAPAHAYSGLDVEVWKAYEALARAVIEHEHGQTVRGAEDVQVAQQGVVRSRLALRKALDARRGGS